MHERSCEIGTQPDAKPDLPGSQATVAIGGRLLLRLGWLGGLVVMSGGLPLDGLLALGLSNANTQNATAATPETSAGQAAAVTETPATRGSRPSAEFGSGVRRPARDRSTSQASQNEPTTGQRSQGRVDRDRSREVQARASRRSITQRQSPASSGPTATGNDGTRTGNRRSRSVGSEGAIDGPTSATTGRTTSRTTTREPAARIDHSDDYNLGATRRPEPAPATVRFAERSSGCETTAAGGGLSRSCGGGTGRFRTIDQQQLTGNQPGNQTRFAERFAPPQPAMGLPSGLPGNGLPGNGLPGTRTGSPGRSPLADRLRSRGRGSLAYESPANVIQRTLAAGSGGFNLGQGGYFFRGDRPAGISGNGNIGMIVPLAAPAPISSTFGWRFHPVLGYERFHAGTDFGAAMGSPVVAALDGRVEVAGWMGGYGLAVLLDHGSRKTLYGHMSELFVQPGTSVRQGETIGRVGSTGMSTGPHLHFEVRELTSEGWVARDPSGYLMANSSEFALARPASGLPAPLPVMPLPLLPGLPGTGLALANAPLQPVTPLPGSLPGETADAMMLAAVAAVKSTYQGLEGSFGATAIASTAGITPETDHDLAERNLTGAVVGSVTPETLPIASGEPSSLGSVMPAPAMAIE